MGAARPRPQSTIGYSQFYTDVKAGNVTKVEQDGETLTVTTTGGTTYTVIVPNNITGDVFADMQKAAAEGGKTPVPRATRGSRRPTRPGSACC